MFKFGVNTPARRILRYAMNCTVYCPTTYTETVNPAAVDIINGAVYTVVNVFPIDLAATAGIFLVILAFFIIFYFLNPPIVSK